LSNASFLISQSLVRFNNMEDVYIPDEEVVLSSSPDHAVFKVMKRRIREALASGTSSVPYLRGRVEKLTAVFRKFVEFNRNLYLPTYNMVINRSVACSDA
jgi:hypothetical protein